MAAIRSLTLCCCLFLALLSYAVAINLVEMSKNCGCDLELDDEDESFYIEFVYDGKYEAGEDCKLEISGEGDQLMITFKYLDIDFLSPTCAWDSLEVKYGLYDTEMLCGYENPDPIITTKDSAEFHFRSDTANSGGRGFGVIINRVQNYYDNGDCDFQCDNRYCIDDDLRCDLWNNCGDDSDEKDCPYVMSAWLITVIVLISAGVLFGTMIFLVCGCCGVTCCIICKTCKKKPQQIQPLEMSMITTPPMVAPPMVKVEGASNTMYPAYAAIAPPPYDLPPSYDDIMAGVVVSTPPSTTTQQKN